MQEKKNHVCNKIEIWNYEISLNKTEMDKAI